MKIFGHRFFDKATDGGPESHVTGYWLVEIKSLFSIALLRFGAGSRESYHSHAFNSISWVLQGGVLAEELLPVVEPGPHVVHAFGPDKPPIAFGDWTFQHTKHYRPGWRAIRTLRSTFHRVFSIGTTWVLTFRGPWAKTWQEHDPRTGEDITLAHGRKVVAS